MTDAEALLLAALLWPHDEIELVRELPGSNGDRLVQLRRPRRAVHILNAQGVAVCHPECTSASVETPDGVAS
jgi:hypothetical protein